MKKSIIFVLTLLAGITTVSAAEPETQTDSVAQAQNAPQVTVKKNADEATIAKYDVDGDSKITINDYLAIYARAQNPSPTNQVYAGSSVLRRGSFSLEDAATVLDIVKNNK